MVGFDCSEFCQGIPKSEQGRIDVSLEVCIETINLFHKFFLSIHLIECTDFKGNVTSRTIFDTEKSSFADFKNIIVFVLRSL